MTFSPQVLDEQRRKGAEDNTYDYHERETKLEFYPGQQCYYDRLIEVGVYQVGEPKAHQDADDKSRILSKFWYGQAPLPFFAVLRFSQVRALAVNPEAWPVDLDLSTCAKVRKRCR